MRLETIENIPPVKCKSVMDKINYFFDWMEVLPKYKNIFVIANSSKVRSEHIITGSQDLLIVFNYFNHEIVAQHTGDTVVIRRQFSAQPLFHGHRSPLNREEGRLRYFALSDYYDFVNVDNVKFLDPFDAVFCTDFIPYVSGGKMASSGYTLLYILNHYLQLPIAGPDVHMIGFEFAGLSMHDWEYEKQQAEHFIFSKKRIEEEKE